MLPSVEEKQTSLRSFEMLSLPMLTVSQLSDERVVWCAVVCERVVWCDVVCERVSESINQLGEGIWAS